MTVSFSVEIFDGVRLTGIQFGHFRGFPKLVGQTTLFSYNRHHIPVLHGIFIDPGFAIVSNIIVFFERDLLESEHDERGVILFVIGNSVHRKHTSTGFTEAIVFIAREGVNCSDLVVVPTELPILGRIETDALIVDAVGEPHNSRLVEILAFPFLAGMCQSGNETKRNETKRNETKRNETKRNKIKK
jgi:hypothetical protein